VMARAPNSSWPTCNLFGSETCWIINQGHVGFRKGWEGKGMEHGLLRRRQENLQLINWRKSVQNSAEMDFEQHFL
jgi:hypothetical protein